MKPLNKITALKGRNSTTKTIIPNTEHNLCIAVKSYEYDYQYDSKGNKKWDKKPIINIELKKLLGWEVSDKDYKSVKPIIFSDDPIESLGTYAVYDQDTEKWYGQEWACSGKGLASLLRMFREGSK